MVENTSIKDKLNQLAILGDNLDHIKFESKTNDYWKLKTEIFADINKEMGYAHDTVVSVKECNIPCSVISLVIELYKENQALGDEIAYYHGLTGG